jgi:hypothetical protein
MVVDVRGVAKIPGVAFDPVDARWGVMVSGEVFVDEAPERPLSLRERVKVQELLWEVRCWNDC